MENTGRIRKLLSPAVRRLIFKQENVADWIEELEHITRIDQAHVLMLAESGIVNEERVTRILEAINRLRNENFIPLRQREAGRGLFMLYEDFLIETEGPEIGGILQTARSRNDLNATVLKLRLRRPYLKALQELLRLVAMLLRRAENYSGVVMPLYTHGQAAMPGTYGHYLAGVAAALLRDCEGLLRIAEDLQSSPLGAGALAGTSFPICTDRTAELLGFDSGPINSLDAVASRDCVLRLISGASTAAVTLSRLATDLMQWATAEFDFLRMPDELVGASSAMPQKRNPFLLEHIQGRAASLVGAFVHASTAMHATPFTNSIAVGTESVKPTRGALQDLSEMALIIRMIVTGSQPNREAMLERAARGFTTATEFANNLVREANMDFRSAHRLVGTIVLAAQEQGNFRLEEVATPYFKNHGTRAAENLDPSRVAAKLEWGGGPGPSSLRFCLERLQQSWCHCRERKRSQETKWREASAMLQQEVKKRLAGAPTLRVAAPH